MNALPTPPLVAGPFTATPSVPQQATPTLSQAQAQAPSDRSAPPLYRVSLAVSQEDVRAAQRLRHQVFAGELGARLDGPEPGLDSDAFDAYCDHLLVREVASGCRPSGPGSPAVSTRRANSTSAASHRSATT
jgi:putative hemolysin